MYNIPEEVFYQVFYHDSFLKLPVKSLLASKFVCKTWYDLISNPDFIKSHLDLTIRTNKPNLLLKHVDDAIRSVSSDSSESSVSKPDEAGGIRFVDVTRLWCPRFIYTYVDRLLCSCNGVVCIWLGGASMHGGELLCFWNPATGEYKILPKPPAKFYSGALGYDRVTGDYKLIVIGNFDGDGYSSKVHVYSLASNSWKRLPTIPYTFPGARVQTVVFNGYFHWLGLDWNKGSSNKVIVSLDISNENFKKMQPPEGSREYKERLNLGVLEGCLCGVVYALTSVEVWEMLEYGVQESWTRCYIITNGNIIRDQICLSPVRSFGNGKILLQSSSNTLILYDPQHGSTATVKNIDCSEWVNYFESLVSLKSGSYVGRDGLVEFREP